MTELRIGDQLICFDSEATVHAYSQISQGDADRCGCSGCRNFGLQRDKIYPGGFRSLLDTLGVDPKKEGEAVHYGPKDGVHFYGGWFYFVGKVVDAGERLVDLGDNFQCFIGTSFPPPPAVFGKDVAAVEFSTLLPWIIDEPWDPAADKQIRSVNDIITRYQAAMQKLANTER